MASSDYWRKREERWNKEREKDEKKLSRDLQHIYQQMSDEIEDQILIFYQKYADKNELTLAQAKQLLDRTEIEYYSKLAKKYCEEAARDFQNGTWDRNPAKSYFTKEADWEMKRYNTTMKISRLQMIKHQIDLRIAGAQGKACQAIGDALSERAFETYKRQAGILGNTVMRNAQNASVIVNASFHGQKFSKRIWGKQQDKLKKVLTKSLQDCLILGKGAAPFVRELKKETGKSYRQAQTLLSTELSRVQTQASLDSMEASGFKEFQFITGSGCCDKCQEIDGQHFKIPKLASGTNAPPMHPNCRCSIAPFESREDDGDFDEAAFDEWADTYDEHGMSWEEWQAKDRETVFNANQVEQEYKSVSLSKDRPEAFTTNFREERTAYPIEKRKNWYVEEGVQVKPRQVHVIQKALHTAMKAHGLSDLGKTRIIIVNDTTLSTGALAAYDPVQDVLKLGYYLANKESFELDPDDKSAMPYNLDVTMVHELFHWKDAKDYREKFGEITQDKRNEYFSYRNRVSGENVKKLLRKYTLEDISAYSSKSLGLGKYDEVYTELRTYLLNGGRYEQIRRQKTA